MKELIRNELFVVAMAFIFMFTLAMIIMTNERDAEPKVVIVCIREDEQLICGRVE